MAFLPASPPENWGLNEVKILITNVSQLVLTLAGGIAVIYLIFSAYSYFTAFGNEEKANKAKTMFTYVIIGLAVILLAKVFIAEVWSLISLEPFKITI